MLKHGVCYEPEQWTTAQAKDHVRRMVKARIQVVRMGPFSWSRFEPEEGRFEFDWMDSIIDELAVEGISTILCTPTAAAPPWALTKYPDMAALDRDACTLARGGITVCSRHAPEYIDLCTNIVATLAERYSATKGVVGWQLDPILTASWAARDYSHHARRAFQLWLKARYPNIHALNEAWGASALGSMYSNWGEIPLPRHTPPGPNPGHWLDFARFSSDSAVRFQKAQYQAIKETCKGRFVTHILSEPSSAVDHWALGEASDFTSVGSSGPFPDDPLARAYLYALARSVKKKFWVLEQPCGAVADIRNQVMGPQPEPGEMRRWAWQAAAHGARGVVHARWRTPLRGIGQLNCGLLDQDGFGRDRYKEARRIGGEFFNIAPGLGKATVSPCVAILRDCEQLWSCELQPAAPDFDYDRHCFELYGIIRRLGHNCAFAGAASDWTGYTVLLAPALRVVDVELLDKLSAFIKEGGVVVFTPQSGTRTSFNALHPSTSPGLLLELAGAMVQEVRPLYGRSETIAFSRGGLIAQRCNVTGWTEVLECLKAEALAEYSEGRLAGKPVISRREYGLGHAIYMGAYLPPETMRIFLADILPRARVRNVPEGVEVTERSIEDRRFLFIMNHLDERAQITLEEAGVDIISGEKVGPAIRLAPNGVLLLEYEVADALTYKPSSKKTEPAPAAHSEKDDR